MTDRPAILIMQRHLAPLTAFLEGAYTVYRFWEGPPVEARDDIRAMVVAGEFELDKHLVESLPRLELIACFTAGYDGIDVDWCRARGLPVTHAPGVNHEDVADHALGLIISARRRIAEGDRALRAGQWTPDSKTITPSLNHLRIGVVGLGAIGEAVARRCEALRMRVSWWGPREKDAACPAPAPTGTPHGAKPHPSPAGPTRRPACAGPRSAAPPPRRWPPARRRRHAGGSATG